MSNTSTALTKEGFFTKEEPTSFKSFFEDKNNLKEKKKNTLTPLDLIQGGANAWVRKNATEAKKSNPREIIFLQRELIKIRNRERAIKMNRETKNAFDRMEAQKIKRRGLAYKPQARKATASKSDYQKDGFGTGDNPELVGTAGEATNQPDKATSFKDHSRIIGRGMLGVRGEVRKSDPNFFNLF